jgi:hypothetical protein
MLNIIWLIISDYACFAAFSPVVIEVPHFAALRDGQREITVLRSDDGLSWRRHSDLTTLDAVHSTLSTSFEGEGDYRFEHVCFYPIDYNHIFIILEICDCAVS